MSDKNLEVRKGQIKIAVDEYYKRTHNNYSDSLEELTTRALNKYLDSDISIRDICINITKGDLLVQDDKTIEKEETNKKIVSTDSLDNNIVSNEATVIDNPVASYNPVDDNINEAYEVPDSSLDNVVHKSSNSRIEALLLNLVSELNHEGIDYQLDGDWVSFIKCGNEDKFDLTNIVIHLNEKDINRFKNVCSSLGLDFKDNRMDSNKTLVNGSLNGESEVRALSNGNEEVIKVVCFERLLDGTVIDKEYYHDENGLSCCREDIIGSNLAKEVYGKVSIDFQGQTIPVVLPEYIYLNGSNENKNEVLAPYMNDEKISLVRDLMKNEIFSQFVPVNSLPPASMVNTKSLENDNSEISQMLNDTKENEKIDNDNKSLEDKDFKVKELKNQSGKIDGYTIVAGILVVVALVLAGLIGFMYFQG